MTRKINNPGFVVLITILLATSTCVEDLTLQRCTRDEDCDDKMSCRAGRCFHVVPPWVIPPCDTPAATGRCCDVEPAMIPADAPDCGIGFAAGAGAGSAPARGPDGEIVVAIRTAGDLSMLSLDPGGRELWRAAIEGSAPLGSMPSVRVDGDGRAYADRSSALWVREPDGEVRLLEAGGTIDGGYAVCKGGVAVALVRGPEGRGPVRLDDGPERWPLTGALDRAPALAPVISQPDGAVAVAWLDGTVSLHDLSTGLPRGVWPDVPVPGDVRSLATDGDGHLWVGRKGGVIERLSIAGELTDSMGYLKIELGTPIHTPPVLPGQGAAMIGLGDGRVVRGNAAYSPVPETFATLVTAAPGALSLLAGEGLLLDGACPEGRCLSIFFSDAASHFGAAFDSKGEHRYAGLPADAAVGLPGPEGLAALVTEGRLEGLVVVAPPRDAPWPGPDGGPGNGRCAEDAE
jgi:hypothetical protein